MSEFTDGLTEERAKQILDQARERLPHNNNMIGLAVLEVLEMPLPEGIEPIDFERTVLKEILGLVKESFS